MEGVAESEKALRFWREEWLGHSFMAIGANDPDLELMQALRSQIRGCPEPLVVAEAGHFVQEWGEPVARAAAALIYYRKGKRDPQRLSRPSENQID